MAPLYSPNPMAYSLRIGLRHLRSKKRSAVSAITFVAVTGVALGVGALLVVLAITSGFQDEFRDKVLGVNAHVLVLKYGLDFREYEHVIDLAEKRPEVVGASPFLIHEMMLAKEDRLSGVLVKGVDPQRMGNVLDLPRHLRQGSIQGLRRPGARPPLSPEDVLEEGFDDGLDDFLAEVLAKGDHEGETVFEGAADVQPDTHASSELAVRVPSPERAQASLASIDAVELPDDASEAALFADDEREEAEAREELPGIVVGVGLRENLGLRLGDVVRLISPTAGIDTAFLGEAAGAPQSRLFRVVGVFEAGFQEYDTRLVYIDLYEAQRFYNRGDAVTGVEMRLGDLEQASSVASALQAELGGPFHTMDWGELNEYLFEALRMQKTMLSLVIATIIFVAAFNVIATLIMVVLEKKREIAILKAMGAKDRSILSIFLLQGVVVGLAGTLIGLAIGGGLVAWLSRFEFPLDAKVYLIDHLPVRVSPWEFLWTILIALGICTCATLVPSWWAARLIPAEGVRYE